jgi:hypothetical protein
MGNGRWAIGKREEEELAMGDGLWAIGKREEEELAMGNGLWAIGKREGKDWRWARGKGRTRGGVAIRSLEPVER